MLDGAAAGGYAFPAMRGFADAGSDGIVQITVGGARYLGGDALAGARAAS
jgi:fructose-bisphosphate aldolase, class II